MRIGLTGGIGSGKTTALHYFESFGAFTLSADGINKTLIATGQPAYQAIIDHWGKQCLLASGELNRSLLRDIIFSPINSGEKDWLESLLHPLIAQEIKKQTQQLTHTYAVIEIPVLFESKTNFPIDRSLVIEASPELQVDRVCARDHSVPRQIEQIIASQCSSEERLSRADDIIYNTSDLSKLKKEIEQLHKKYLALQQTAS